MTYFRDLSPYDYWKTPRTELCVGWLSKDHPFPKGYVPNGLVKRLRAFLDTAVNQTRGFQGCDFCTDPLAYYEEEKLASAELRVFARNGTVFAAPTLIIHYITAHKYQPAQDFIEAVMQNPIPPDPSYLAQLEAFGANITDWAALRSRRILNSVRKIAPLIAPRTRGLCPRTPGIFQPRRREKDAP